MNEADVTRTTVIKAGNAFCVAGLEGEIAPDGRSGLGAFLDDCRHLCRHAVRLNGVVPRLLVSSDQAGAAAVYELTNPAIRSPEAPLPLQALRVRLERRMRPDGMDETIRLHLYHPSPVELALDVLIDADFRPMLELRGLMEPIPRGVERDARGGTLRLSCVGLDGWRRETVVSGREAIATGEGLRWRLRLTPREDRELWVSYRFAASEPEDRPPPARRRTAGRVARRAVRDAEAWLADRARIETDDELVDRVLRRSLLDLRLLVSDLDGQPYVAAGVPWYATLFGRDALICALQVMAFDGSLAAGTLRLLAAHQGSRRDDRHDEEPGRIIHELRLGELARVDRTPLTRYYGTVDATPLFLILLCRQVAWTGSTSLLSELRPAVDAALAWLDGADSDGDGLIEYRRRAPGGLEHQGWKDSSDGICDEDGRPLAPPIALAEAQAYAIRAREEVAALLEHLGERGRAEELRRRAIRGRAALEALWLPDLQAYAMALDGTKRPSRALASNQGHLLWARAIPPGRASAVRDRLMSPGLFSGWGVRTLAVDEAAFNPVGYHTGSVWPHDSAIAAAGLREYGFDADFRRVTEGLLDAAAAFHEYRLPELFAGFSRDDYEAPVPYPVACRPQAWAAGSVPYLLTCALGLEPDALAGRLRIRRPTLPRQLNAVAVRGLRVGAAVVDLRFERVHRGEPAVALTDARIDGDLEVVLDVGVRSPGERTGAQR